MLSTSVAPPAAAHQRSAGQPVPVRAVQLQPGTRAGRWPRRRVRPNPNRASGRSPRRRSPPASVRVRRRRAAGAGAGSWPATARPVAASSSGATGGPLQVVGWPVAAQPQLVGQRVDRPRRAAVAGRRRNRPLGQRQGRAPERQAGQKVVGAVHRVDEPGAAAGRCAALLADQAVGRTQSRSRPDDQLLGGMIGGRHHVGHRGLVLGLQAVAQHPSGQLAGLAHQSAASARSSITRLREP